MKTILLPLTLTLLMTVSLFASQAIFDDMDLDFNTDVDIILVVILDTVHSEEHYEKFPNGTEVWMSSTFRNQFTVKEVIKGEFSETHVEQVFHLNTNTVYDNNGEEVLHFSPVILRDSQIPRTDHMKRTILLYSELNGVRTYLGFEQYSRLEEIRNTLLE